MPSEKNLKYKDAMRQLEAILERVDNTDIGIDELAAQVQEATVLLKACRGILSETELKVQGALESLDAEFKEKES